MGKKGTGTDRWTGMVRSLALVVGTIALLIAAFLMAGLFVEDPAVYVLRRFADLIEWIKFWN